MILTITTAKPLAPDHHTVFLFPPALEDWVPPDHNSIWRFWRDHKAALRQVFQQSVLLAIKVGLGGFALQAVDGTKIQAGASSQTGWKKEGMEKKLAQLNQELDQAEAQVEAQQSLAFGPEPLPAALADRQALKQQIQAGLEELQQSERAHDHPHEPEAHRMYCEGRSRFAYNAQAVADAQQGIVTAAEVTGQETDMGQRVPMLQAAQANTGQAAACTVGDTHYGTTNDLVQAKLQRRKVIIEPVFATVKQRLGFRRWTVRGLANVAAQWALVCTGVNLLKMGSLWRKGALSMSG